jgi:hypothetical protein
LSPGVEARVESTEGVLAAEATPPEMPTKSPVVTAAPAAKPETFLDQPFCLLDLLAARRAARFMETTLYTSCVATRRCDMNLHQILLDSTEFLDRSEK